MHPFHKEIFMKGGINQMSSYDLIWILIQMLLENKDNELKDNTTND